MKAATEKCPYCKQLLKDKKVSEQETEALRKAIKASLAISPRPSK